MWLQRGRVPFDYPGPVAEDWPELLAIVEERVKPERDKVKRLAHRERWWQYGDKRPKLYQAIAGLERVLATSRVSEHSAFAFLPSGVVYSDRLIVFPLAHYGAFCILQSRLHEVWARFFGSSLEDRLTYTPSDCFETFPFPTGWETAVILEEAGLAYYAYRAELMACSHEGLTKTYNRLHDPHEMDPRIHELRELHGAMDKAVASAYGWRSMMTDCEFLLDYEIEETNSRTEKKPYRYRWPDEVRDEVLARLVELNSLRAEEERRTGRQAHDPAG